MRLRFPPQAASGPEHRLTDDIDPEPSAWSDGETGGADRGLGRRKRCPRRVGWKVPQLLCPRSAIVLMPRSIAASGRFPKPSTSLGWVGVRRRPVATHGLHADRARASCLDYRLPIQAVGWLRNGVKASSEAVQLNLGGVSSERTDERLAPHCVDAAHSTQMAVEAP